MQVHGHRTRRKHVIEKRGESSLRTRRTHRPTRSRQEPSRVTEPAPPATSLRARSPSEAGHLQRRGLCLTHTPLRGQDGRRADPRAAKPLGTAQAGRSRVSTARQGPAVGDRGGRSGRRAQGHHHLRPRPGLVVAVRWHVQDPRGLYLVGTLIELFPVVNAVLWGAAISQVTQVWEILVN